MSFVYQLKMITGIIFNSKLKNFDFYRCIQKTVLGAGDQSATNDKDIFNSFKYFELRMYMIGII